MARKAQKRISYVLPLPNSSGGHRLGVNGLAVDRANGILYSAGRDGAICTWDTHLDLRSDRVSEFDAKPDKPPASRLRQQIQAHTHWINDIALAESHQALVSASSDVTVKLWRPAAQDPLPPQTIGVHSDYVKVLASPSPGADWIASGGLDRKIAVWDLRGGGQRLGINVGDDDDDGGLLRREKGSVYALAATQSILAAGGPEKTVRVWDARSGSRITKLVGHTDNIRDVLISQDGAVILTASSDTTVKVWSTSGGRCISTLTMHDASVWSLFSDHPELAVFYSSDKTGLIAKTDARHVADFDDGACVAVAQEHEGVHKVLAAGDHVWTATSRPSINRWRDVDTANLEIEIPERFAPAGHRVSVITHGSRHQSSPSRTASSPEPVSSPGARKKIPLKHMLRLSNTSYFPVPITLEPVDGVQTHRRAASEAPPADTHGMQPVRAQPDGSIEGQNGLIKHVMLPDRRRVLTLDTAGDVVLWDLLKCVPVKSYGKRHIEDVRDEEPVSNTVVAPWCTVDTRTGSLAVALEENTCFDAEMYADELDLEDAPEFREDARINLGKWVLRWLFAKLVDEEVRRDEAARAHLLAALEQQKSLLRENAPGRIQLPTLSRAGWHAGGSNGPTSASTLRPSTNGTSRVPGTPGFSIGLATPGLNSPSTRTAASGTPLTTIANRDGAADGRSSHSGGDKEGDYFTTPREPTADLASPGGTQLPAQTPVDGLADATSPTDASASAGLFGKKFRMGMSFKKLGRTTTNEAKPATAADEEKDDAAADDPAKTANPGPPEEDSLHSMIARIRFTYAESLQHQVQNQLARENGLPVAAANIDLPSALTPPPAEEVPVLHPPDNITILIQEDRPEAGGVADLFEGTVGALGLACDTVERAAPLWLADALLRNRLPLKDIAKTSFVLEPWGGLLPPISAAVVPATAVPGGAAETTNRLNANRMLRARKILAYVAERIEPPSSRAGSSAASASSRSTSASRSDAGKRLKPEEYLELYCQDKLVPPKMTLYTIRTQMWKGPGNDVVLQYKANGRKVIRPVVPPKTQEGEGAEAEAET